MREVKLTKEEKAELMLLEIEKAKVKEIDPEKERFFIKRARKYLNDHKQIHEEVQKLIRRSLNENN